MIIFLVFTDVRIDREQSELAANRLHMACEAFGCGTVPQLQSAVYKVPPLLISSKHMLQSEREKNESHSVFPQLETKFKDDTNKIMTEREKPFRCAVKFSSTNLLESLRHCASTGMNKNFCHRRNRTL